MHSPANIETSWPDAIYAHFRRIGNRQVGYVVPDAGHSRLITLCATHPLLIAPMGTCHGLQSSGVGNCINTFSLLRNCGFGCIVLVTMRCEFGEFRLCGFLTYRIETGDTVDEIVGAGCDMTFDGNLQVAFLLSQRLIGPKQWTK